MNPQERERLVDSALDRALGPQLIEPRTGLEDRILANLQTQPQPRPWWRWMWIPALAAAAVLAVVIGMRVMQREQPAPAEVKRIVETPKQEAVAKPKVPATRRAPTMAKRTVPLRRQEAPPVVAASLPRMDVFPAPAALTEQERLLLALVNRQRPQAQMIAAEQQADREKIQKYFETGEAPVAQPTPVQPMR